jgi:hypothetical protein
VSTLLVKDIYTGASSSSPDQFTLVGNKLYFVADDGVHGRELWGLDLENLPPTVDSGGPYAGAEGSPIVLNGTAVDDDLISVEWVSTDPGCVFADTTILDTSVACADNGEFVLTLVVLDWWNVSASDQTTVTVSNAAPQIISLSASDVEAQISQPVEVVVQFSDAGQADTHVANIDWDDGTELEMLVDQVAHFAVASHIYSNPGLFTVRVTVIDDDGASVEGTLEINITQRQLFLPLINR